jgi:hypothetical protein
MVVIAVVAAALLFYGYGWRAYIPALLVPLIAFSSGLQAGTAIYQTKVDYSTTYNYGQQGIADAAAFIRANTAPDDVIVSMKDLGFLARRRYIENYIGLYEDSACAQRLIKAVETGRAKYAVFTEGIGEDQLRVNKEVQEWVLNNCTVVAAFGNYRVYKKAL